MTARLSARCVRRLACVGCLMLLAVSKPAGAQQPVAAQTTPEARLAELKLELPALKPPAPGSTIVPVVIVGNLAFVSGHTPSGPDGKLIAGRVGEDLDVEAARGASRQIGLKMLAVLRGELGSLNRVKRVVKVLGMVNAPRGFGQQPAVINGFSELLIDVFGPQRGKGARSAVGVSSLPSNAAVEIEAVFEIEP